MTSTSTFRIPKARITGLYGRILTAYARRTWGQVPVVELTMMVAIENERSRFNSAPGLKSQGFSDVCELPLAQSSALYAVRSGS
jgi:hypothetical protein